MMEKWIGWIPACMAMGKRMLPIMIIAGIASINIPTIKKMRDIIRIVPVEPRPILETKVTKACGTLWYANSQLKVEAVPTQKRVIPVNLAVSFKTTTNFFQVSDLFSTPTAIEYSTAIAEASVGVKIPKAIPPMMMIGVIRPGIEEMVALTTSLKDDFAYTG
jgi:hypothetical protein